MLNYNPNISSGGKQTVSAGAPWRLLIISAVLFILCVVIFLGMDFGYTPYLNSEIQKADASIADLSKTLKDGQQKDVVRLYSQLYNVNSLYASHVYPSRIFSFLEKEILPTVRIISLDADIQKLVLRFDAVAPDLDTVVLQVSNLQGDSNVQQAILISSKKQDPKEGGGFLFSVRMDVKNGWLSETNSVATTTNL